MFEGNREQDYRAATERNAKQMNGVRNKITFVCRVCKQVKPTTGRKMMVKDHRQFGFRCACCVR